MRAVLLAALLLLPLVPAGHAAPLPTVDALKAAALPKALAYLEGLALSRGGDAYLVEAVEGAGLDPAAWPNPTHNILDSMAIPEVGAVPQPTRPLEAYLQSGYGTHLGGRDLVADLKAEWPLTPQDTGFATFTILGLHAAGLPDSDPTIQDAVTALQSGQATAGSWICFGDPRPNVDCTGFALTALASVHALLPSTATLAKAWLDQARNPDGSYAMTPGPGGTPNTQSTLWAINGYRAVGAPEPEASWRYILGLQQANGAIPHDAASGDPAGPAQGWATKEVVASLWHSFALWPTFRAATALVPAIHADAPATLSVAGSEWTTAAWSASGAGSNATATGTHATLALDAPGAWTLALDARGAGIHHRERIPVTAANDPPAFVGLPASLVADRVAPFTLQPQAVDPEGQPVTLAWSLDGVPGDGPVAAAFHEPGPHTLRLTATDPHGASAQVELPLAVVNLPPQLAGVQVPATAAAGRAFSYAATASDPDGPAPTLQWSFGSVAANGPSGETSLPTGHYTVQVTATDSEGATASLTRTLEVVAPAPPPPQASAATPQTAQASPAVATPPASQVAIAPGTATSASPAIAQAPAPAPQDAPLSGPGVAPFAPKAALPAPAAGPLLALGVLACAGLLRRRRDS